MLALLVDGLAHAADLQTQGEFGAHYLSYWVDEVHEGSEVR